jgi:diguanylate cyclase (GGDEF)-like protein/PAS domain S-box-containing protein
MENLSYSILILSILAQIAAIILSLRLVWITKKFWSWVLVALGITLMTARRGSTLYYCIAQGLTPNLTTEVIALISSSFLLLGLSLIGPLFLGLMRRTDELLMLGEEKYRLLANTVPAVVFRGYVDGSVDLFDDKIEEMVGYDKELFISRQLKWTDLICPEDQETAKVAFIQALKGKGCYVREYRVKSKESRLIWIQERSQIFFNEQGKVDYISGVFYDITECRLAEEALRHSKEELTSTVQILQKRNHELTLLSEMGDLLQSCYNVEEAYGVVGNFLQRIFHEEGGGLLVIDPDTKLLKVVFTWGGFHLEREVFPKEECWALRNGRILGTSERHVGLCRHPDAPIGVDFLCLPMVAQGDALGVLRVHGKDVTHSIDESKRQLAMTVAEHMTLALANLLLRETLRHQSIRDALTGLYNRRYLEEVLDREIYRAVRHQRPLAIIMLDVDHFKRFNDEFGHDAGDSLLREMGSFLKAAIRQTDSACRYGGEEFLVIMPETTLLGAVQKAEKLREKFKNLNIMHQGQLLRRATISLGVAAFPEHGSTVKILIQMADKALYQAKAAGRDRVEVAPTYREEGEEEATPEFMAQSAENADLFSNGPKASF